MKKLLLFLGLISSSIFAQSTLVKDINKGNNSSNPGEKIQFNNEVYFAANDGIHGKELWKTDGTETGTVLVKDLYEGEASGIGFFTAKATSNFLYFFGIDEGKQFLMKTDGTAAGTEKVKEVTSASIIYEVLNDEVIFSAQNQLWKSDGTAAGTVKIANFAIFGNDRFVKNGNEIYFSAEASSSIGKELYKTDGTTAGTVLVKDIRAGASDAFPNQFTVLNGVVYFSANNGSSGTELWRTDGTASGTIMVKDVNPNSGSTFTYNSFIEVYNNVMYFIYNNNLWKSDGTDAGTVEVKTDLGAVKKIFTLNNKLLIIAYNATERQQLIWISDGTAAGTTSFNVDYTEFSHNNSYAIVGNNLFFQGTKFPEGYELWKTDGTAEGTFLVKDIHPQADDNNLEGFVALNDKVIFTGSDGNWLGKELYISDGTAAGTFMLKDINKEGNRSSNPQNYFQFGNKVLFSADNGEHGRELWLLENGVASLLKDINPGSLYSNPSNFTELDGQVYFTATSAEKGKELWKTDGTAAGTVLVNDNNPNQADGASSGNLQVMNNKLYFFGNDGATGLELWETDGTAVGTKLVKDINGTDANSIFNSELVVMNNELFFAANDGTNGAELWKSDGTEAGTVLVKDINTNGSGNIRFLNVHPYLNKLYFSAYDGSKTNLWESAGLDGNTAKINNLENPSNFRLSGSRNIGGRGAAQIIYDTELFFTARNPIVGTELYAVTYTGSVQNVHNINPGNANSYPVYLTDVNGQLYFVANNGTNGNELWKANGVNHAEMVKDIQPGKTSSYINSIGNIGDVLIFGAGNNSQNKELWKSDGTASGTVLLEDMNPSTETFNNGSRPESFFTFNNTLYFSANNGTIGSELYQLENSALSVNENRIKDDFKVTVYPNPSSNYLNIKIDKELKSVKLFSVIGKQVMRVSTKNLDISHLPKGMYLLQIETNSKVFKKKIIKN